jgi:type IV secretion system protein VirB5
MKTKQFTLKKVTAALALTAGLLSTNAAHAGVPVIDVANLAQSIMQVIAWAQQYGQMDASYVEQLQQYAKQVEQWQQQVQHYQSITGTRNLGDIMNNPALQQVVPGASQLMTGYSAVNAQGFNGLSSAAQSMRSATMLYNCQGRTGDDLKSCQAFLNSNAATQANSENALNLLTQRASQIQSLQGQINSTTDPKAISELQARIAAETAQVGNDSNRLAVMRSLADTQDRGAQQQIKERELRMLASTVRASDTFVYVPH